MTDDLGKIVGLFLAVWGIIGALDLLVFVGNLNATYVPSTENAINYLAQIMAYLIRDAVISAIVTIPVSFILDILS